MRSERVEADASDIVRFVTAVETVLVLAVIPAALYALITLIVMWPRFTRPRYRAGQEWNFAPVLWVANPVEVNSSVSTEAGATEESTGSEDTGPGTAWGGARGNW